MQIRIYDNETLLFSGHIEGPVELGRQQAEEPLPYAKIETGGKSRLIIASRQEQAISRRLLFLDPLPDQMIRVCNLSSALTAKLGGRLKIPPGNEITRPLPISLEVGRRKIQVLAEAEEGDVQSLSSQSRLPSHEESLQNLVASRRALEGRASLPWDQVVEWLRSAMNVLQVAASTEEFFHTATEAAISMVGLDSSRILIFEEGDWQVRAVASASIGGNVDWRASRRVLNRVRKEKRTFWKSSASLGDDATSLTGFHSVVAAPILNQKNKVIAVLYGDRRFASMVQHQKGLTELDAILMELLASGIGSGLARIEQERTALATQAKFEAFFTPRLSRRLMSDESLLEGQERKVTVFFCDLRGFSRITDRLGPQVTVRWLNDVMNTISELILGHDGVVVDYSGDQVMAMWGAPEDQPDQVEQACTTALAVLRKLPALNARWKDDLKGEMIEVGIGIDSGLAFVGNIGSQRKFKYGPLGNTVNQASRIQGATKYLNSPLLISDSTLDQLSNGIIKQQTRRVGRVKMVNIDEPILLHEVVSAHEPDFAERKKWLHTVEHLLEQEQTSKAHQVLQEMLQKFPDDGPAQVYLRKLEQEQSVSPPAVSNSSLWELPGK